MCGFVCVWGLHVPSTPVAWNGARVCGLGMELIAYACVLNPMTSYHVILWTELGVCVCVLVLLTKSGRDRQREKVNGIFFMPNEHKWSILFLSQLEKAVANTVPNTRQHIRRGEIRQMEQ